MLSLFFKFFAKLVCLDKNCQWYAANIDQGYVLE